MSRYEDFTGKVAVVTGGTKGIGGAVAKRLHAAGAKIVVSYASDATGAENFVKEVGGSQNALAVQADAGSLPDNEKLVNAAVAKFGKIDLLIPNAGTLDMKDLMSTSEQAFDRSYATNVKGPYFLVQKAVDHMPPGSRIILISTSLCGSSTVTPNYLLYCSTKGAIEQMVRVLSKDLVAAPRHISVNAVAPGPTATDMFLKGKPEQVINGIANLNPQKRLGQPDEVADAILLLAGPNSRWVTGQLLRINGGFV